MRLILEKLDTNKMASSHLSDDNYDNDEDQKPVLPKIEPDTSGGFPRLQSLDPEAQSVIEADAENINLADGDTSMKSLQSEGGDIETDEGDSPQKTAEKRNEMLEKEESNIKSKKAKQDEERRKMQVLVSHFSEDQLNRYEMYRRAAFPKAAIKRLMQAVAGTAVPHNVVIAMSGIAKVFVGEIIEEALDTMEASEESGPLQPKHIREAVRKLKNTEAIQTRGRKKMKLS